MGRYGVVAKVLVRETKHVQQVLRNPDDQTMNKAKRAVNAAFKTGELDETNLKF